MKKIIFFVFCIILLTNTHVYAQEHALNDYGYYSIKNAACVYNYNDSEIKISFTDDSLSEITFVNSKSAMGIYAGSISFQSFFDKETKEFKCPEYLYIFTDIVNNRGSGQGLYVDLGHNEGIDYSHTTIQLIANKSFVEYNEKKEGNNNTESYNVICKLKKITRSSGSSIVQNAAPVLLDYVEKLSKTNVFVSNNNEYTITNGNFDCSDIIQLNLLIDMERKTIEISNCSEGINQNCVVYERFDYANSGYDSGINKDGSNNNSSELVTPSSVGFYSPEITKQECSSLLGSPDFNPNGNAPAYYLTFAFKIIRYVAIIILIVLSTMDFLSAVASHDDDELKKAMNKTIIRFVLCVIIFLLPTLIAFILRIINNKAIDLCINTH